MWHAIIMEVEAADGGGGQQLSLKDVLVHGEPYEYKYEDTREQYAPLYDKTGNKELPYVLHMDTRGVYAHGMHYHGQNADGSWHEPVAELSGTGTERPDRRRRAHDQQQRLRRRADPGGG